MYGLALWLLLAALFDWDCEERLLFLALDILELERLERVSSLNITFFWFDFVEAVGKGGNMLELSFGSAQLPPAGTILSLADPNLYPGDLCWFLFCRIELYLFPLVSEM